MPSPVTNELGPTSMSRAASYVITAGKIRLLYQNREPAAPAPIVAVRIALPAWKGMKDGLLLPGRVGNDTVVHAVEVVVDRRGGRLGRYGGVHAGAQGVLEGGAPGGVESCGGPACCGNCKASVSEHCFARPVPGWERERWMMRAERNPPGVGIVPRTDDMTFMHGFSTFFLAFRTRRDLTGGRRMGFCGMADERGATRGVPMSLCDASLRGRRVIKTRCNNGRISLPSVFDSFGTYRVEREQRLTGTRCVKTRRPIIPAYGRSLLCTMPLPHPITLKIQSHVC